MKLPYSAFPVSTNAAFPRRTQASRPIVGLLLSRGDRHVVAYALVDSGADSCIFPVSIAESLGIPIPNERAASFSGSRNEAQVAYYEEIQATILPMEAPQIASPQEPINFPLYAGFCETLEHVGMGLLGQDGFFSRFSVSFPAQQSYFEIL